MRHLTFLGKTVPPRFIVMGIIKARYDASFLLSDASSARMINGHEADQATLKAVFRRFSSPGRSLGVRLKIRSRNPAAGEVSLAV